MTDDRSAFTEARTVGKAASQQRRVIWDSSRTYAPDATECGQGHPFTSEADCVLPEGWDNFMCRRCIDEAVGRPCQPGCEFVAPHPSHPCGQYTRERP